MATAEQDQEAQQLVGVEKLNTVDDLLNCNKILIKEINSNHEARTPEGLARNVILIRELNKNVSEVVKIYQEVSTAVEDAIQKEEPQAGGPGPQ